MDDFIDLILDSNLEYLDGFELTGDLKIPKDLLIKFILQKSNKKAKKKPQETENQNSENTIKLILKHIDLKEMNVYFDGNDICLKLDVRK